MKRHNLFYLFSLIFSLSAFGQVEYVNPEYTNVVGKINKDKTNEKLIKIEDNFFYTAGVFKKDLTIGKYNSSDLSMEWTRNFKSSLDQGKQEFDAYDQIMLGDKIHLLYSGFDKKESKFLLIDKIIDKEGTEIKTVIINEVFAQSEKDIGLKLIITEDKKNIVLRVIRGYAQNSNPLELQIVWFDADFNEIGSHREISQFRNGLVDYMHDYIDENLNYYLTGGKKVRKTDEVQSGVKSYMYKFSLNSKTIVSALELEDFFLDEVSVHLDKNINKLIVHGFYGSKKAKNIDGVVRLELEPEDLEVTSKQFNPFDESMVSAMVGKRSFNEKMMRGDKVNYVLRDIHNSSDGSTYYVYEDYYKVTVRDQTGVWVYFVHGDVMVFLYDKEGNLSYTSTFPHDRTKNSFFTQDNAGFTSYLKDDKLNILYSLIGKDADKNFEDLVELDDLDNRDIAVFKCSLDNQGNADVETIFQFRTIKDFWDIHTSTLELNKDVNDLIIGVSCNGYGTQSRFIRITKN